MDMSRQIRYRPMQAGDLDTIAQAFEQTWTSPFGSGTPIGALGARYCLVHYLSVSTCCDVAVKDKEILGVTMARVTGEPLAFPQSGEELDAIARQLKRDPVGSQLLEHTLDWYATELELEQQAQLGEYAHAELELFLVMANARGLGVGSGLFSRVRQYFAEHGAPGFFLHTDTDSDYGFYAHQGLRRAAERHYRGRPDILYIYVGSSARHTNADAILPRHESQAPTNLR